MVTLDTWMLGWRPRDLQHAYLPFLKGEGVANYFSDPVFRAALERPPEEDLEAALGHWAYQFSNPAVTWADLEWLREETELPIVLKGILHADDARRAAAGGRGRLDRLEPRRPPGRRRDRRARRARRRCARRSAASCAVLFDSGIRTGADVFKAIALGAEAVCVGRPYMWGLALDGQAGVEQVLRCLLAELDLTLGAQRLHDAGRGATRGC